MRRQRERTGAGVDSHPVVRKRSQRMRAAATHPVEHSCECE
jgi:hypothetical protein